MFEQFVAGAFSGQGFCRGGNFVVSAERGGEFQFTGELRLEIGFRFQLACEQSWLQQSSQLAVEKFAAVFHPKKHRLGASFILFAALAPVVQQDFAAFEPIERNGSC